jgi:hypothetical protein
MRDWGMTGPTWRAAATLHGFARSGSQTVSSSHFQIEFSPKFQQKVHKTLNTKVAQQLTLYKIAKGSRGF